MEILQWIIDFVLHIDVHLTDLIANYGDWVYAILFLIIFCETGLVVTPFLPGDSLLFVAGTLAAIGDNHVNVHLMVLLLIGAAILGDSCNYTIGKFLGEKLFRNPDSKLFKRKYLEQTHEFYEKHGGKTIILARFVPIIRTFAPFVAGMGKMTYIRFISFCVLAAVLWVSIFMYLGYFFGELEFVQKNLSVLVVVIIFVSLLPGIIEILRQRRRRVHP
ncbi:MAG: putative membrane protein [Candidatus Ordinivivax streblomastigis]|uniref:Putative membrane protein n=1 Tax=Candidatus Ordinivivax streblomastigis TaxID=2540710 RepID=A0A5M8NY59_9BACT|nr:MAG: putative membrane protein [Candidatus Ordinivivax streblomastigis]